MFFHSYYKGPAYRMVIVPPIGRQINNLKPWLMQSKAVGPTQTSVGIPQM